MPEEITKRLDALHELPPFKNSSKKIKQQVDKIFSGFEHRRKGEVIFLEGEQLEKVFLLVEGKAKTVITNGLGNKTIPALYREGDFLGESDIFTRNCNRYMTSTYATDCCLLATASKRDFLRFVYANPGFAYKMFQVLSLRLKEAWLDAHERVTFSAEDYSLSRVSRILAKYGTRENGHVVVNLTHQELADMCGTARETMTRSLAELKKTGLLQTKHGSIVLLGQ
jgi:CRP-like cAMP-binding protein